MTPIRAFQKLPPLAPVFQIDGMPRRRENQRAGIEHVRQRAGIIFRIGWNLSESHMSGSADKFLELPVGHRCAINPEIADGGAMDRRFFGIMSIRSHAESAAGDLDHIRGY